MNWLLILIVIVAANLPWFSDRFFFLKAVKNKKVWVCLAELLILYGVVGLISLGLEKKSNGIIHSQDWEFYVVTFCLFIVISAPGFIVRYIFKK